ncbi:MAG: restriction endonuclease subunit S [Fimbriimonadaceae bacterium]|nr:restriction endonuclease subunit S [Fimbriimonadaceae bacterium]
MRAVAAGGAGIVEQELRTWKEVKKGFTTFQDGDVIFAKITPCMENGKFAVAENLLGGRAAGSTEFHVMRPGPDLDARYLLYFLFTDEVRRGAKESMSGAVGQQRVPASYLAQLEIPLPSIETQREIVANLDARFSRLDAGVAALKRAQANLKRYRASVLKAACEGRLVPTEAELARQEGRSYESGPQLLERILEERRTAWTGKGKYKEPTPPDTTNLPEVPEGWTLASFDQLTENHDGRRIPLKASDRDKRSGPYPYYGASGIIDDIDDFLFDGEFLLIGEDGANLLARATPIAYLATGKFWVNNHAHVVQSWAGIPLRYLANCLNAMDLTKYVTGSAQPKLTQFNMNQLPILLPPLAEQERIVAEVERRLSVADALEATLSTNVVRSARSRQVLLRSAFAEPAASREDAPHA